MGRNSFTISFVGLIKRKESLNSNILFTIFYLPAQLGLSDNV